MSLTGFDAAGSASWRVAALGLFLLLVLGGCSSGEVAERTERFQVWEAQFG